MLSISHRTVGAGKAADITQVKVTGQSATTWLSAGLVTVPSATPDDTVSGLLPGLVSAITLSPITNRIF